MVPKTTFELKILFDVNADDSMMVKENVMAWLSSNGHETFVEGVLDSLDIEPDYLETGVDMYAESGGNLSPLSVFEYEEGLLLELKEKLLNFFGTKISVNIESQDTSTWMEGWKESFKPIATKKFIVHPPWDKPQDSDGKMFLEIEPGMAFGTGQHATTMLCMYQIERLSKTMKDKGQRSLIDIGTGSGILAIAAKKLGFGEVKGTDIESAAVHSAKENAKVNEVDIAIWKGSVPVPPDERDQFHKTYDVVVANILIVVLERIIFDIAEITDSGAVLILSGFLREQEAYMRELAEEAGFAVVDQNYLEDWACLELEKL